MRCAEGYYPAGTCGTYCAADVCVESLKASIPAAQQNLKSAVRALSLTDTIQKEDTATADSTFWLDNLGCQSSQSKYIQAWCRYSLVCMRVL